MTITEETLMAYVDGELDPAASQAVESAMREDPQIEERVARHQALRQRVRAAFSGELDEQVPERLLAAATGATRPQAANVVDLKDARATIARSLSPARRNSTRATVAIAASLVAGVGLGFLMWGRSVSPLALSPDGALVARGSLASALSEQLAAEQLRGSVVQIGISFLAKSGDYCRTFALSSAVSPSGLACRHGREWQIQVLSQAAGADTAAAPEYRTAGSAIPTPILKSVEAEIVGEPLDQTGESEARRRDWIPVNPK